MRATTKKLLIGLGAAMLCFLTWGLGVVHGVRLSLSNPSVLQRVRVADGVTLYVVEDGLTGTLCGIVPATGVSCTWDHQLTADSESAHTYAYRGTHGAGATDRRNQHGR